MATEFDVETVPVAFNMDLANGPTSERFCDAAAALLGVESPESWEEEFDGEIAEAVEEWNDKLSEANYCAMWDAGDVVVYDLRELSEEDREAFYSATENW